MISTSNFFILQERLYGIGSWCGLMLLLNEFTEPFILDLTRKRDDSSLMRSLQAVGGLGKVVFLYVFFSTFKLHSDFFVSSC